LSISDADIERWAGEIYDAGRKIMPRDSTVVEMLAVLGNISTALFVQLKEAHGAEKITPIFDEWLRTMAELSGLEEPLRRLSFDRAREWLARQMATTAGSTASGDPSDVVH
jgi:hypothetical protein